MRRLDQSGFFDTLAATPGPALALPAEEAP
jgi:hypothetical protein